MHKIASVHPQNNTRLRDTFRITIIKEISICKEYAKESYSESRSQKKYAKKCQNAPHKIVPVYLQDKF